MVYVKIIHNDMRKDNIYKTFKTKTGACDYLTGRGFVCANKKFSLYVNEAGDCAKVIMI